MLVVSLNHKYFLLITTRMRGVEHTKRCLVGDEPKPKVEDGTTEQPILVTFRCAVLNDVEKLASFFLEPDETSCLLPRSRKELRAHVEAGEVFVIEVQGRMAASTTCRCLSGDARDQWLGSLDVPARIALELIRTRCIYACSLYVARGMRNKVCATTDGRTFPNFAVAITAMAFLFQTQDCEGFAYCACTNLGNLRTLHLAKHHNDVFKAHLALSRSDGVQRLHTNTMQIPVTKPGTKERGLLSIFTYKPCPKAPCVACKVTCGDRHPHPFPGPTLHLSQTQELERTFVVAVQAKGVNASVVFTPPTTMVTGVSRRGFWEFAPADAEAVVQLMGLAAHHSLQFDIISTGKTWGAPSSSAGLRIRMGEMRNIPLLDLANGVVAVEPGVTQGVLADLLRGSGWYLPVTGSCRHSSLVGNALDGGITMNGLRIKQVLGVEAVEWSGLRVKTGLLATPWHGHGFSAEGAESFLGGARGAVTCMAFRLERLPRHVGVVVASMDDATHTLRLYEKGIASWWQTRVTCQAQVVIAKVEGDTSDDVKQKISILQTTLGKPCQTVQGSTDDAEADLQISGNGPSSELFLKDGWRYMIGIPSCSSHRDALGSTSCDEAPQDGNGFSAACFAAPFDPTILGLLRDRVLAVASADLDITITMTPMGRPARSIYFLVWATYDRRFPNLASVFMRDVREVMSRAMCPPRRASYAQMSKL